MLPIKLKRGMIAFIIAASISVAIIHFTSFCNLEAVTFDGDVVTDFSPKFGLTDGRLITRQPLDSVALSILASEDVQKVDLSFDLPNGITIQTNRFETQALVLSERTGRMYGLDRHGRVVPIDNSGIRWDRPVMIGCGVKQMFVRCADPRLIVALDQLEEIRDDRSDLYQLVAEVDFGKPDYLKVRIDGLPYMLKTSAGQMSSQLDRFFSFVADYGPDLNDVRRVDLRYDDMIIVGAKD